MKFSGVVCVIAAYFLNLGGVGEIIAPQAQHVAPRNLVILGVHVDHAHAGAASFGIDHVPELDRLEFALLDGDHRAGAAFEQVLRRAIAEVARVLHVERDRIGAT